MYADRDKWVADPDLFLCRSKACWRADYIVTSGRVDRRTPGPAPAAGMPAPIQRGADATNEAAGTSHFVVVDREGNIASMTTTVESLFGSGRAVGGFMLNNQLSDFSFGPVEGWRSRSRTPSQAASGRVPRWRR